MKMRANSRTRQGRRGSALILFTLILPSLLIPIVGLGIDATMLYIVQGKLSAAVDGAALGAGRLLGTPADPAEIAGEFLKANFRADGSPGFWGAYNLQPTITYTPGTTKTVTINATAQVPLLFARVFGQPTATVSAYGRATRTDSRVEFIIDRSGSMDPNGNGTGVIANVISYTQGLVQKFTSGVDELGLVVYDGSGVVGYPASNPNWDSTTTSTSTGGPDTNFMNGASTDMLHAIQAITAANGTGMADALSIAYIELQKAHMRDLAANGVDQRLNSIVLFTDGVPSAISLYMNNPASTNANNIIKSTSSCTNKTLNPPTPGASNMMIGWLAVAGSPPYSGNSPAGMSIEASIDTTSGHNSIWWMSNGGTHTAKDATSVTTNSSSLPFYNCTRITGSNLYGSSSDMTQIPNQDMWGNATNTNAYLNSYVIDSNGNVTHVYTSTALNFTSNTAYKDDYQWGLAQWNAADSAAANVRKDVNLPNRPGDTQNMGIQIFTIGYSGNSGGTDSGLLLRIANDKGATGYTATQPTGQFILASNTVGLQNAFATVASAILRLAQ
jgi:Flp pilus assembly protein TadG